MKKCLDIKKGFVSLHHTTRVLLNRHKIGCLMSFQLKDGFLKPKTLIMTNVLVVMSHNLNDDQVNGLNTMGLEPVILSNVNSDLANTCKQIDPNFSKTDIQQIADSVVKTAISEGATHLMIQGEPSLFFSAVENAKDRGLQCLIATTKRVSVERENADGTIVKTNVFKHVKFREL